MNSLEGLVWSTRPNDVETQIIMRSRQIMKNLEEETGINSGWINNGGLFCATTKERLDEFKRMHTVRIEHRLYQNNDNTVNSFLIHRILTTFKMLSHCIFVIAAGQGL